MEDLPGLQFFVQARGLCAGHRLGLNRAEPVPPAMYPCYGSQHGAWCCFCCRCCFAFILACTIGYQGYQQATPDKCSLHLAGIEDNKKRPA